MVYYDRVTMNTARTYISVLILLLLVAGPWLQGAQAIVAEQQYCNCCDGVCTGCCCSMPVTTESQDDHDACSCEFEENPVAPPVPAEVCESRVTSSETAPRTTPTDFIRPTPANDHPVSSAPPPETAPPPAYILHSAFLI